MGSRGLLYIALAAWLLGADLSAQQYPTASVDDQALGSEKRGRAPTAQELGQLAHAMGITPNHPLAATFQAALQNSQAAEAEVFVDEEDQPKIPLKKHIKGDRGIPYLKLEQLKLPRMPTKEEIEELARREGEGAMERYKEYLKVKPLPQCPDDHTVKVSVADIKAAHAQAGEPLPQAQPAAEADLIREVRELKGEREAHLNRDDAVKLDLLFVESSFEELNPDEAFGRRTKLKRYNVEKPTTQTYMARALSIPCLPFRIRQTGAFAFHHMGKHALLNYDEDPNGEGKKVYNYRKRGIQDEKSKELEKK